uniref:upstream stimulatory factor 2-like isoform X7 n=1 Tax=Myxine glutinosa TaxID=7769 RepID=UPI00358FE02E
MEARSLTVWYKWPMGRAMDQEQLLSKALSLEEGAHPVMQHPVRVCVHVPAVLIRAMLGQWMENDNDGQVGSTKHYLFTGAERLISPSGQFYVMMASQDVLQGGAQRTIAPRTHPYIQKGDGSRTPRDERRRAQHNEVERRRRDKINNWIVQLSKVIPDCSRDHAKTGQPEETSGSPEPPLCLPAQSKGGILSKACDYIQELRQTNQRMMEALKEAERIQMDNELLRQKLEDLESERSLLRAQLQQHGIEIMGSGPGQ